MNPDWEITKGCIWGCACTWLGVQDSTLECWLQGVAGRSPADQPQTEPEHSEMIQLIKILGEKNLTQTEWLTESPQERPVKMNAGQVHFPALKTKLHSSHQRSRKPDLVQHEHAQSAIILRSFLGGQKRSDETETYKVATNVLLCSLF